MVNLETLVYKIQKPSVSIDDEILNISEIRKLSSICNPNATVINNITGFSNTSVNNDGAIALARRSSSKQENQTSIYNQTYNCQILETSSSCRENQSNLTINSIDSQNNFPADQHHPQKNVTSIDVASGNLIGPPTTIEISQVNQVNNNKSVINYNALQTPLSPIMAREPMRRNGKFNSDACIVNHSFKVLRDFFKGKFAKRNLSTQMLSKTLSPALLSSTFLYNEHNPPIVDPFKKSKTPPNA